MTYKLIIEYVKNTDAHNLKHVGKITLLDDSDSKVFNKKPVIIPEGLIESALGYTNLGGDTSVVQATLNASLKPLDTSTVYNDLFVELSKDNNTTFIKSGKNIIFASNDNVLDHRDKKAFIVSPETFKSIKFIVDNKKSLVVELKEKWFFWFPKSLDSSIVTNINETYIKFMNKAVELQTVKDAKDKELSQSTQNSSAKNAEDSVWQLFDKKTEKPTTTKNTQVNKSVSKNSRSYRSASRHDDNDPLNVLLAFTNPTLAVFMRPQSLLAWAMYMNSLNTSSAHTVENSLHNIDGFEDLTGKYKETQSGYQVGLYDNQGNYVGDVNFDLGSNSYTVNSVDGQINTLDINNNQFDFGISAPNAEPLSMNLVQTNDGFVGNWYSDSQSGVAPVNAGVVIGNDFSVSSNPDKLNDLSGFDLGNNNYVASQSPSDNFDFGSSQNSNTDIPASASAAVSESVLSSWNSSDPYNNN